ncbi:MAG: ATP-binding protein [Bacteroidales bacterium]|nr:ATP-binding protein [Bacteroidales bacterium]MDY6002248.1 ATP-binding protein [Candidatus Cryptobacteroides sp.]
MLMIFLAVPLSCQKVHHDSGSEAEMARIDSIVYANHSVDSLEVLTYRFIKEGNRMGELVANRELGTQYRRRNDFFHANACHQRSLEIATELSDTIEMIKALNNLGTNYRRLGVLEEATSYHYMALEYTDVYSRQDDSVTLKNKAVSLNGIGNIYITLGNLDLADSICRMALVNEKRLGSDLGQAINYANIGSVFESKGNLDSARIYYSLSMESNRKANSTLGISLCHDHFGRLYEKDGDFDKAVSEYESAYKLLAGSPDKWHWLDPCLALANVHIKNGDLPKAKEYMDEARSVAQQIGSLEHLSSVYHSYYEYYSRLNDYKDALDSYVLSNEYSDSVVNSSILNKAQNARVQLVQDRMQKELQDREARYSYHARSHRRILAVSFIALSLALLVIIMMLYLLRSRKKMNRMLQKLEKMRTDFYTNITHELRTPLTVILGYGKQLENGELANQEEVQAAGKYIRSQGGSLLNLVNQLLDISKVRSNVAQPEWRRGNIVPYVQMIVDSFSHPAKEKFITLRFAPKQNIIEMDFVPDYVGKIVRNLVFNSIKYTGEHGNIAVTLSEEKNVLELRVADNGRGIAPEDMPHIFEAFYQGSNDSGTVGTGIGLSLVDSLVKAMGGRITVKSAIGQGSVFTVDLPLSHGDGKWRDFEVDKEASEGRQAIDVPADGLPSGVESDDAASIVLVVEDNSDISRYIGSELKKSYALRYAVNGREGADLAKEIIPDLIISDIMMPEMDGLAMCRELKASEITNHIPVIFVTARSSQEDKIKGIEAGGDAYLYKPFSSDELNAHVESLLRSRMQLRRKFSESVASGDENAGEKLSDRDQQFLNHLIDVAYSVMADNGSDVETVASKMCMTRTQLNRKLQAVTGETSSAYLLRIRLSRAKRLLDDPKNFKIGDIAFKCGFEDFAYFSRVFKQKYGVTPSQYRKRVTP